MKNFFLLPFFPLLLAYNIAKVNPVKWDFTAVHVKDNLWAVDLTATIEQPWHIYAQKEPPESICQPTIITFTNNPLLKRKGSVPIEIGIQIKHLVRVLQMEQFYYEDSVKFEQLFIVKYKGVKTTLKGTIEWQVCTDEQCLLPTVTPFKIELGGN